MNFDLKLDRPLDCLPLGRAAIDLNPLDYYKPLSQNETFRKYLGGSPANIAVGLSRLGAKVGFIGKISDDGFGSFIEESFAREGIDLSGLSRCQNGEPLGLTFTEILSPTQSSILMYRERAADLSLSPEDIDEGYLAKARMLLISGSALSLSPSREAAFTALKYAEKLGLVITFDLDYRPYSWKSADEIAVYCALCAERAQILLGSREEFNLMEKGLGLDGSDEASALYWASKSAKLIVIKHGKEGSVAFAGSERYRVLPYPVEMLKGFGGGDGYASALLYGIFRGYPLSEALTLATASASMLVKSHACSKDMPDEQAIRDFISSFPKEQQQKVFPF